MATFVKENIKINQVNKD